MAKFILSAFSDEAAASLAEQIEALKEAGITIRDGGWSTNYPHALSGHDPIGCNDRIGRAAIRLEAERLARAIKLVKEDQNLLRWHAKFQEGM